MDSPVADETEENTGPLSQCLFPMHHPHMSSLEAAKSGFELLNTTFFHYRKPKSIQTHPVRGGGKRESSCKIYCSLSRTAEERRCGQAWRWFSS